MSPASQASQATVSPTRVPTLALVQSSLASSASPRPPPRLPWNSPGALLRSRQPLCFQHPVPTARAKRRRGISCFTRR
ncbi:hypothetical protein PF010_g23074 [Phytophthora fragariae]|uniref:Uncharacterized protein n=1 Tax=Phytophthora fragariae TaxID=53985 RepID=A0A6G0K7G8_9STRA|nr:hypothetical protein PF010_g23074 [Phytophthora fragariae]